LFVLHSCLVCISFGERYDNQLYHNSAPLHHKVEITCLGQGKNRTLQVYNSRYLGFILQIWHYIMFDFEKTISPLHFSYKNRHKWSNINITRPQNLGTGIPPQFDIHPRTGAQCYLMIFRMINGNKLRRYKKFKCNIFYEKYLNLTSFENRKITAHFRISLYKLKIETDIVATNNKCIPPELRLCNKCNINRTEDEYHFILVI
jgi:hypothetical protein